MFALKFIAGYVSVWSLCNLKMTRKQQPSTMTAVEF